MLSGMFFDGFALERVGGMRVRIGDRGWLPHSLSWLQRFLYDVCEPYLRLFRRILPALGPLDVSPIVGVLVLVGVQQLAVRLIGTLD